MYRLPRHGVRRRETSLGNVDGLQRLGPRMALLDRAERAAAAQRQAGCAVRGDIRRLSGENQRKLAGLEIGHFDLPAKDVHIGATSVYGDTKLRSLHHGSEIGRFDLEMLGVAFLSLDEH